MEEIGKKHPGVKLTIEASQYSANESMMSYLTYMAIRLVELNRILKPTGTIYLHCDPTASHYLKIVMDAIFGKRNFRNEIIWTYNRFSRIGGNHFPRMHDTILFYSKTDNNFFNPLLVERRVGGGMKSGYDVRHNRKKVLVYDWIKFKNAKHRLNIDGYEIKDHTQASVRMGCTWEIPIINSQATERTGFPTQKPLALLRRILEASSSANCTWTDIPIINSQAKERCGYPTQKPLALLDRIIKASSNAGDLVFDPFCGCATTMVMADRLQRSWVGIDVSEKAAELADRRIRANQGDVQEDIIHRTDIPMRTDSSGSTNHQPGGRSAD